MQIIESGCLLWKAFLQNLKAKKKIFKLEVWTKRRNSLIYLSKYTYTYIKIHRKKHGRKFCIFSTPWILKEKCKLWCKNVSRKESDTEGKQGPCWDLYPGGHAVAKVWHLEGLTESSRFASKACLKCPTNFICCLNWSVSVVLILYYH